MATIVSTEYSLKFIFCKIKFNKAPKQSKCYCGKFNSIGEYKHISGCTYVHIEACKRRNYVDIYCGLAEVTLMPSFIRFEGIYNLVNCQAKRLFR